MKTLSNKIKEAVITVAVLYVMFTFNMDLFTLGQDLQANPYSGFAYNVTLTMIESQGSFMDSVSFKLGYYL